MQFRYHRADSLLRCTQHDISTHRQHKRRRRSCRQLTPSTAGLRPLTAVMESRSQSPSTVDCSSVALSASVNQEHKMNDFPSPKSDQSGISTRTRTTFVRRSAGCWGKSKKGAFVREQSAYFISTRIVFGRKRDFICGSPIRHCGFMRVTKCI